MAISLGWTEIPEGLSVGYHRDQEVQANYWRHFKVWGSAERPICMYAYLHMWQNGDWRIQGPVTR